MLPFHTASTCDEEPEAIPVFRKSKVDLVSGLIAFRLD